MSVVRLPLLFIVPVVLILGSQADARATIAVELPAAVLHVLEAAGSSLQVAGRPVETEPLKAFYQQRDYQPVWIDAAGMSARGEALLQAFQNAAREGLDPTDYAPGPIVVADPGSVDRLAAAELAVSAALVRYAADVRGGRASGKIERDQRIASLTDPVAVLTAAAGAADPATFVENLAPSDPIYVGLRQTLARYRALAAAGGWPELPEGPTLVPGVTDGRVGILRLRLQLTGDLAAEAQGQPSSWYDDEVRLAVRRFQERHGLRPTGTVSEQTQAMLNVPVQNRIRQIVANMERARRLPDALGNPYVLVNLAAFDLQFVEGGRSVLRMRVVVGEPDKLTPTFSDEIAYIELNPFWNVPKSIAVKEKLPLLKRNPAALKAQNIRLFAPGGEEIDPMTVGWSAVNAGNFVFRLRQDPGPVNALGRIKFMFPNAYDVYLHDTPARALFRRQVRAFSHGCIRIERPIELAALLLRGTGWGRERIEQAIASGQNRAVALTSPVPVHLVYLTMWVDHDGRTQFRDDHYNLDAPLLAALTPPASK